MNHMDVIRCACVVGDEIDGNPSGGHIVPNYPGMGKAADSRASELTGLERMTRFELATSTLSVRRATRTSCETGADDETRTRDIDGGLSVALGATLDLVEDWSG